MGDQSTDLYTYIWALRDLRVEKWLLMSGPWFTVFSSAIYLYFSTNFGPKFMANRKPYSLKIFIIVYNFIMVWLNAWIAYKFWTTGWGAGYNYLCQPVDLSLDPKSVQMAETVWLYFLSKFIDWLDTLFFVLTKKISHVNILHVVHHASMPFNAWVVTRFAPGGHVTLGLFMNSVMHIIMYFYYAVSSLGPKFKKYLWWKQYITALQMVQFIIGICHYLIPFIITCDFPKGVILAILPYGPTYLFLFVKFYRRTYNQSMKVKSK